MPSEMLKLTDGNSPLYHPTGICWATEFNHLALYSSACKILVLLSFVTSVLHSFSALVCGSLSQSTNIYEVPFLDQKLCKVLGDTFALPTVRRKGKGPFPS